MNEMTNNNGQEAEQPKNYKAEGEKVIESLKNDKAYCMRFFFDTEVKDEKGKKKKNPCQIASLRSKMIYELKKDYDVEMLPEDFSTIVYLTLWAEGTWEPLNSYLGNSSFYAWLKKVAKNAVLERLEEEHQIDEVRSRSVGNTRLALLSQAPSRCKVVIDDMMIGSKYHGLLTAIYVDRLTKDAIMKRMKMSDNEYEANKKAGENKLKDALLRSVEYSEENFIRDKKKHVVMVSSDYVADLSEWCKSKSGVNPLADVLGVNLSVEELSVRTVQFLYDFSARLNWSERDRYIWQRRFIINADAEGLGDELGHNRKWVDNRYSRLNKVFKAEIRKWWKTHAA